MSSFPERCGGQLDQPVPQQSAVEPTVLANEVQILDIKASAASSVATLINVGIGAGILSLPFAFACTGWALGLALTVLVAGVEVSTLYVLCRYAEQTGARSYSALVNQKLGLAAGVFLSCVMAFYLLLTCTAYLMIASDSLLQLLGAALHAEPWWLSRQAVVAALGFGVALPLSLPRRLGAIAAVSTCKVYAILFVVGAVAFRSLGATASPNYSWHDVHAVRLSQRLLAALPILVFGFQCNTAIVSVWDELEDAPSLLGFPGPAGGATRAAAAGGSSSTVGGRASAKLQGMLVVAAASIGAVACFYSVMGVCGYLAFPSHVESNIMNSFRQDDPLMQVARAMVGLIVIAAYPVNSLPARATFLDLLGAVVGDGTPPGSSVGSAGSGGGAGKREEGTKGGRGSSGGEPVEPPLLLAAAEAGAAQAGILQRSAGEAAVQPPPPPPAAASAAAAGGGGAVAAGTAAATAGWAGEVPTAGAAGIAGSAAVAGVARRGEFPAWVGTAITLCFCVATTGIALEVSDLGAMFQLIGGTAASTIMLGIPGALLIQAALAQHAQQQQGEPAEGRGLQEPLLPRQQQGPGGTEGFSQPGKQREVWWWGSGVFWAGVGMEVATVGLWGVTLFNLFAAQ